jgi:hypothetical protein
MTVSVNVYVDESGDTSLAVEKEGVSDYYAITAIVVPTSNAERLAIELEALTQGQEIKSAKIRSARRASWIRNISEMDFYFHTLIVDKKKINENTGLAFKKTFIKYFSRRLYERLQRVHDVTHLFADEHGSHSFMSECERYYRARIETPMLEYLDLPGSKKMSFSYVNSQDVRLIQLADLVCGTIRRVVEGKDNEDILKPLESKRLALDVWPPCRRFTGRVDTSDDFDSLVQAVSYGETVRFINNSLMATEELEVLASIALSFLLDKYHDDPECYHNSGEIREYLLDVEGFDVSEYKFKQVIGYIRTSGVPIASSEKGYKIPNNGRDIGDFVKKVQSTVDPYIQRLGHVRDLLVEASLGKWDILGDESYEAFRSYLNSNYKV